MDYFNRKETGSVKSFLYYFTLLCSVGTVVLVTVNPQAVRNVSASFGELCGHIAEKLSSEESPVPEPTKSKEERLADFLEDSPYRPTADCRRQTAEVDKQTADSTPQKKPKSVAPPPPVKNDNIKIANEPFDANKRVEPAIYQEEITDSKPKNRQIRWAAAVEEKTADSRQQTAEVSDADEFESPPSDVKVVALSGTQLSPFSSMTVQPLTAQPIPTQPISSGGFAPPVPEPQASTQPVPAESMPMYSSVYQQPLQPAMPQYPSQVQQPMQQFHPSAQPFEIQPSVISETVPCHGTETVARVGTQVILMCDILPQLRRAALRQFKEQLDKVDIEEQKKVSAEEKEQFIEMFITQLYPQFLKEQIHVMLIYNDFIMSRSKEEVEFYLKNLGEQFDEEDIPEMMKEFGVNNLASLKTYLNEELGSSLERERLLTTQSRIAQQWLMGSVKTAEGECTHGEMMEYYTVNQPEFTSKSRVKYRELTVNFANHKTKLDTWKKIVWMGNETARGVPFDEMAKVNSEGFTASKGGLWDWIARESIASKELEQVLFTQAIGMVNPPIIETAAGLHIIQIIEREEARLTPFIEAQVQIREKIKMQRRQKYQNEYLEELTRKFPSIVLRETIDFKPTQRAAQNKPAAYSGGLN